MRQNHIRNGDPAPDDLSDAEKRAYDQVAFATYHRGYGVIQGTRPQTIGYSLADTPVGLAAWLLDHDATTYEHLARLFAGHGHFAAWEQPQLFSEELRAAFRPLR